MQRWIPGVEHISLIRASTGSEYILTTTFTDAAAYIHWRQLEQEASDYWERFAAILTQLESACHLVREYAGETILHVSLADSSDKAE